MNLGWYELMDRIAMIQNQLDDSVNNHEVSDANLRRLISDAQVSLYDAYSYCGEMFNK